MKFSIMTLFDYLVMSCLLIAARGTAPAGSIPMKITNNAGAPIDLFWINPNEQSLVLQTNKPIRNSTDSMINSYNGHMFVVKFQKDTGAEAYFAKGPSEENVIISFDEGSNTLKSKQVTKFHEIMELIDEASKSACEGLHGDLFSDCVSVRIMAEINRIVDATKELKKYRNIMSEKLVDYMCADQVNVNATQPMKTDSFFNPGDKSYQVNILSENDRSKVWTISNWITPEECLTLEQHSVKVSSGSTKDGFEVTSDGSVSRVDAKLNKVHAKYNLEQDFPDQDELWPLYSKTFQATNKVTKFNLKISEQGGFQTTRTSASILFDNSLTCDGICEEDAQHQPGGNVATAIMFCKVAEEGGLMLFPKADLIIQPSVGLGVFFSYKDEKSSSMDDGYTEHVTCPVLRGEVYSSALHMTL